MANNIRKLLEEYNISPNKVLGQNFLIEDAFVNTLIDSANIEKQDIIVEVGPGTGIITKKLAKKAKKVIAIEKDPNLIPILTEELKDFSNIEVINEDILKFNSKTYNLEPNAYKLVGAPPYYLTGRLFRYFLENKNPPSTIALIIQKEVAHKIVAKPPKSNLMSISVQLYGDPCIVRIIPKSAFWPRPKVDSAILLVENIKKPIINEKEFFKVLKTGFSSPRKQLQTNLKQKFTIPNNMNIDLSRRAQTLTIKEWKELYEHLNVG